MTKVLSIFLISVYLLSATEMYQLVKLPFLVSHFKKHRQENPRISLWQFINLHYANGEVFDADHDEDMQLPFKTHEAASHANFIACVAPTFTIVEKTVFFIRASFLLYREPFYQNHSLDCIWQPPKSC